MTSPRRIVLFGECMIELRGQVFEAIQQSFGGDTLNTAIYLIWAFATTTPTVISAWGLKRIAARKRENS